MYSYQVVYHDCSRLAKSSGMYRKGNVDGVTASKELEALILEKSSEGYELHSITPVTGLVVASPYSMSATLGFMVAFRLKDE